MDKGIIKKVKNHNRKFGASDTYNMINCTYDKQNITYLFTDNELKEAQNRAKNNAENIEEIVYLDTTAIKYTFAIIFGMIIGLILSSIS